MTTFGCWHIGLEKNWYAEISRYLCHNLWGFGLCWIFQIHYFLEIMVCSRKYNIDNFIDLRIIPYKIYFGRSSQPSHSDFQSPWLSSFGRTFVYHHLHILNIFWRFDRLPWNPITPMVASIASSMRLGFFMGCNSWQAASCHVWRNGRSKVKSKLMDLM